MNNEPLHVEDRSKKEIRVNVPNKGNTAFHPPGNIETGAQLLLSTVEKMECHAKVAVLYRQGYN